MSQLGLATWGHRLGNFGATPDEMRAHLDRLAEHGFSAVIPCIKNMPGAVDFLTDRADVVDGYPDWDPFRVLNEECGKRGMEVHAWLINFSEKTTSRFRREHPESMSTIYDPYGHDWLCACRPEVQDYAFSLYEALAERYRPAALHLDYIRTGGWCRCDYCSAEMHKLGVNTSGIAPEDPEAVAWAKWKADRLTGYVARVHKLTQRHGVTLSAAVIGDYPHYMNEQAQDWERWVSEGILDVVFPMNYDNSARNVDLRTVQHLAHAAGRVPVWEGLCKSAGKTQLSTDALADQARICRDRGAAGVCVFHYPALTDDDLRALKGVAEGG